MKALTIEAFGGPDLMKLKERPAPEAGSGEIRIKIKAAGLNPVDWKIREGYLKDVFPHHFPIVLGWDCAGVIDQVGEGVSAYKEGDEVMAYCRKDFVRDGSFAEYIVVEARHVAPRPAALSFEKAAALPLAGLTAWQALFDAGQLKSGETVMVHAAAGGVGHLAVQLAKNAGATVIGTASPGKHALLRDLGVDYPLDYAAPDMRGQVLEITGGRGADIVFDCIGGEALEKTPELLSERGRSITIAGFDQVEPLRERGVPLESIFVAPDPEELKALGDQVDAGTLRVEVEAVYPLDAFADAFAKLEDGHVTGKLVFLMDS
ncbi:MAG: NADP-dependent oxidoreductase [Opitutales bacterium]